MSELLRHSVFYDILFPETSDVVSGEEDLALNQIRAWSLASNQNVEELDKVVFDLETTGLDARSDKIIEIGAIRFNSKNPTEFKKFSTLVDPLVSISERIQEITGLKDADLKGQPTIDTVMPQFFDFIDGALLVAHNADFDYPFVKNVSQGLYIDFSWPCICTLKMSRKILAQLESRTLDRLAEHYGLSFSSRHRSIGDCEVTCQVYLKMLEEVQPKLLKWQDYADYSTK